MYYIDFHTHVFHDDIAPRAMQRLSTVSGKNPFTDGTETDMIQKMKDWGIHKAVVLPIATKPTQQETINNWAATLNREYFIPFGTVHPQSETKEKNWSVFIHSVFWALSYTRISNLFLVR